MENKKDKVSNQNSKYGYWILAAFIVVIFLPLVLGYIIPKESIIEGFTQSNDWIGFFGSYTGSILGGVVTLVALWLTRRDTREIQSENKRLQEKLIEIEEENQFREHRTTFIDFAIQDKFNLENYREMISGNILLKNKYYDNVMKELEKYEYLQTDPFLALEGERWLKEFNSIINFPYKVIKNIGEKPMSNVNIKIIGEWIDNDKKYKEELVFNIDCIEGGKSILMPVFKLGGKSLVIYFDITGMNVIYEMGMMNKREKADIKLKYSLDRLSVEKSVEISKINTTKFETYKYNNYIRLD